MRYTDTVLHMGRIAVLAVRKKMAAGNYSAPESLQLRRRFWMENMKSFHSFFEAPVCRFLAYQACQSMSRFCSPSFFARPFDLVFRNLKLSDALCKTLNVSLFNRKWVGYLVQNVALF